MTIGPTPNAVSINKAIPENAGANTHAGEDGNDVEMNEVRSKSGEDLPIANQDVEVEFFLHGITDQFKWQELVSKWLAFENDYPIKGVFFFFPFYSRSALMLLYLELINYWPSGGSSMVAEEGS